MLCNDVGWREVSFFLTCPTMAHEYCSSFDVIMRAGQLTFVTVIKLFSVVGVSVLSCIQIKFRAYFLWTLGKFHQYVVKWW